MQVTIRFYGQARQFAGTDRTVVELEPEATVNDAVGAALTGADERLRHLLLGQEGRLRPSVLPAVDGEAIDAAGKGLLKDQSVVDLHTALAGG